MSAGAKPRPRTTGSVQGNHHGTAQGAGVRRSCPRCAETVGGGVMGEPIEALAAIIAKVAATTNPNRSTGSVGTLRLRVHPGRSAVDRRLQPVERRLVLPSAANSRTTLGIW